VSEEVKTEMVRYEYLMPTTGVYPKISDLVTRPNQTKRYRVIEVRGNWLKVAEVDDLSRVEDWNTGNIGRLMRYVREPVREKRPTTTSAKAKQKRDKAAMNRGE